MSESYVNHVNRLNRQEWQTRAQNWQLTRGGVLVCTSMYKYSKARHWTFPKHAQRHPDRPPHEQELFQGMRTWSTKEHTIPGYCMVLPYHLAVHAMIELLEIARTSRPQNLTLSRTSQWQDDPSSNPICYQKGRAAHIANLARFSSEQGWKTSQTAG